MHDFKQSLSFLIMLPIRHYAKSSRTVIAKIDQKLPGKLYKQAGRKNRTIILIGRMRPHKLEH